LGVFSPAGFSLGFSERVSSTWDSTSLLSHPRAMETFCHTAGNSAEENRFILRFA